MQAKPAQKSQTKCRNKWSLQNGKAISELGLDFVITYSSIDSKTTIQPRSQSPLWSNHRHSIKYVRHACKTSAKESDKVSEQIISSKWQSHQRAGIRFCHHLHMLDSPSVKIHQSTCCMILYHTTKLRPLLFASLFYTLTFRRGVASLVVSSLPSTKPDALKQTIQQLTT